MKKLIIILITVLPFLGFGQTLFEKYKDNDNVESVFVNKDMFRLLGDMDFDENDPEGKDFLDMIENLENLKKLQTSNSVIASDLTALAKKHVSSSGLTQMMHKNENGKKVEIYIQKGRDDVHVKELFMIISGAETIIVSIKGDVNLNYIAKLTKKMNIPGGQYLKK